VTIQNIDQLIAAFGSPHFVHKAAVGSTLLGGNHASYWAAPGIPGAGGFSVSLAGVALTSPVDGQIPFTNAPSGKKTYLARMVLALTTAVSARFTLLDRLWHNGGFSSTSTGAQTVNSAAWPARDANGSTDGVGVMIGLEVSANMGAASPSVTLSYTNSSGVSGRTATLQYPAVSAAQNGIWIPFQLQAGDVGVRSIQTLTLGSSWLSGTFKLVAYREIGSSDGMGGGGYALDPISGGLPEMFDGSVPFIVAQSGATGGFSNAVQGTVTYAQG
jgi:hypothetical protein